VRLDEVAQELYALPPGDFVAARNEHARQAREAGDRALADALRKLRRPTQSAWLVNLLLRERRDLVVELVEVGAEFRGERLTRDRLHELSSRRRELLHRLEVDAQLLSERAGMQLTADRAREVEATLSAAVADQDAAQQVLGGRLATPLSYSGLGPELQFVPEPRLVPAGDRAEDRHDGEVTVDRAAEALGGEDTAGGAETAEREDTADHGRVGRAGVRPGPTRRSGRDDHDDQATAERAAADRATAERAAVRLVRARTEAWEDAVRHRDGLARRRDELRAEVHRIQQRLDRVQGELADAEREAQAASEALEQARQASPATS
jgi:hypothetical protein